MKFAPLSEVLELRPWPMPSCPALNTALSEDIRTIDEMYPSDFKAIKDTSGVDFSGICYNKLVTMEKNVGFTWLLSPEPKSNDFSDILKLDHVIHSEEFRVSPNYKLMLDMFKVSFDDIKRIASETVGQSENSIS